MHWHLWPHPHPCDKQCTFQCFWRCCIYHLVWWSGRQALHGGFPAQLCHCRGWLARFLRCTGSCWCGPDGPHRGRWRQSGRPPRQWDPRFAVYGLTQGTSKFRCSMSQTWFYWNHGGSSAVMNAVACSDLGVISTPALCSMSPPPSCHYPIQTNYQK